MRKLIDANVQNARYLLNMILLAGLIYALAGAFKLGEIPYMNFSGH